MVRNKARGGRKRGVETVWQKSPLTLLPKALQILGVGLPSQEQYSCSMSPRGESIFDTYSSKLTCDFLIICSPENCQVTVAFPRFISNISPFPSSHITRMYKRYTPLHGHFGDMYHNQEDIFKASEETICVTTVGLHQFTRNR